MRRKKQNKQRKIIVLTLITSLLILTTGYAAFNTNLNINIKGNIKEKSRIIKRWAYNDTTDFHSEFYRENIISATFLNTNKIPETATESWDVSQAQDKGVMAYVIPNANNQTKYDLYIGANKGVIANENSSYLFYKFINLLNIDFNNNFDTTNTTNMYGMFSNCEKLQTLDLKTFKTTNVTNFETFLSNCLSLETIDISTFDTTNTINMQGMFYKCENLKQINLTNLNTNKVTNMRAMFMHCINLTTINLCSFNTNKVTTMQDMFYGTQNLTKITVGPNWIVTNAITANMFYNSKISSVTTGEC